jgi:hypothetical protein
LIVSDSLYFPGLKKIAEGDFEMNFGERWNPFSRFLGKALVQQIQETVTKKLKAPKVFVPSSSHIGPGIPDNFQKHLDTLPEYIAAHKRTNINKINITSPVPKWVTYSLRDAITILIHHEHRHINQAVRVKEAEHFPK